MERASSGRSVRCEDSPSPSWFNPPNAAPKLGLARWATYGSGSNISADPLFVDPAAGDFRLDAASPCIDAGDPESLQNDPAGSRSDMGMFGEPEVTTANAEFSTNPAPPRVPAGGTVQFLSTCIGCTHTWDFGDPNCTPAGCNTSDLQAPSHVYDNIGLYTVTHTVTDIDGMTWSVVKQDLVQVYDPSPATAPEVVTGLGLTQANPAHVKAFRYDTPKVNPKVSFFAFSTLKLGANIAAGDVDGDGYDELPAGAGPSPAFWRQVRGFNVDGGAATSIAKINFYAFTWIYGANVASSDVESDGVGGYGDGYDEIVTGRGPGPANATELRLCDYDNASVRCCRPPTSCSAARRDAAMQPLAGEDGGRLVILDRATRQTVKTIPIGLEAGGASQLVVSG